LLSALPSALRLGPEGRLGPDSCYVASRFKAGLRRVAREAPAQNREWRFGEHFSPNKNSQATSKALTPIFPQARREQRTGKIFCLIKKLYAI